MRIAMGSGDLFAKLSPKDACDAIRAAGFDAVDWSPKLDTDPALLEQQATIIVQSVQAPLKLALVALHENRLPNLLQRQRMQCLQIFIGNVRSAIRQAIALPLRRKRNDLFSVIKFHFPSLSVL